MQDKSEKVQIRPSDLITDSYREVNQSFSLTLCDGEFVVSENRAFCPVEGQVVDGGGHIHHQLLAFLHGPQVCVTATEIHEKKDTMTTERGLERTFCFLKNKDKENRGSIVCMLSPLSVDVNQP